MPRRPPSYGGRPRPRLVLTANEAEVLLHEIENAIRFHGAPVHLPTLRSIKAKLGVEMARVRAGGAKLGKGP